MRYQHIWGFELVLRPVLLTRVASLAKNIPHGNRENKYQNMIKELTQDMLPDLYGVKMLKPPNNFFKVASKLENFQRVILGAMVVLQRPKVVLLIQRLTDSLVADTSNRDERLNILLQEDLLSTILQEIDPDKTKEILALAKSKQIGRNLEENCLELVERGGFGSPTMFFTHEDKSMMIFGSDRFELVANYFSLPYYGAKLQLKPNL